MRYYPALTLVLLFCIALIAPVQAGVPTDDNGWSLRKDDDGVRIYSRNLDNSSINAFRAEIVLPVPLENVMAVMAEPGSCLEWVHQCSESYGLESGSFTDRYAYSVNSMPWPVRNRDYVLHIKTDSDPESGMIEINMEAVAGMKPEKNGHVRIEHSYTVYQLTRTEENHTHMVWFQHTEPGGSIPSWLVNKLSTDLPYNSLRELRKVAQNEEYRNHELLFDEEGHIVGIRKKSSNEPGNRQEVLSSS